MHESLSWYGNSHILLSINAFCNSSALFRKLLYGVKQFNLEPIRGLKYLEESGFLEKNPEDVAKFLFRQERLSKKQIGEKLQLCS